MNQPVVLLSHINEPATIRTSQPNRLSVALIVFGAFVAGARDLSFDAGGYAIVFVANIMTVVYLATINLYSPGFMATLDSWLS